MPWIKVAAAKGAMQVPCGAFPIQETGGGGEWGSLVESALCIFPCHVHGFNSEPKSLNLSSCDQETPRRSVCPQRLTDGLEFTTWREWNFVGAEGNYFTLSYFQSLEQPFLAPLCIRTNLVVINRNFLETVNLAER